MEYLNPENYIGRLVELPEDLNPLSDLGVVIRAKMLWANPILNGKLFPAYLMLKHAQEAGRLKGASTLVEATSGNMAVALAILGRYFGISRVIAVVPPNIAEGKRELLRFYGVEVMPSEDGIGLAEAMGERPGYLNLFQYGNNSNPAGYYKFLAPSIFEQMEGKISIVAAGLGTTGTIQGISEYLREKKVSTLVLGVITAVGETIPGVRTDEKLKEIKFDWGKLVDETERVGKDDAMRSSLALSRAGILAGPSSGFVLAGLLKFLRRQQRAGSLDTLRNGDGKVEVVFICFDPPHPYIRDYQDYYDETRCNVTRTEGGLHLEQIPDSMTEAFRKTAKLSKRNQNGKNEMLWKQRKKLRRK